MSSYVALDIGEKRIGVALADMAAPFPAPLVTLEATGELHAQFAALLRQHQVGAVVVGFPRNQNGEPTAQTKRVQQIVQLLKIPNDIPVYWQDESLTSVKAEAELNKRKKPYTKAAVDSLAATFILEDFIREQSKHAAPIALSEQPVAPEPSSSKKRTSKGKKRRRALVLLAATLVLTVGAVVAALGWYVQALKPRTSVDSFALIRIKSGSSTNQIAAELQEKQIIKSARAFSVYVRLKNVQGLQAGEYRLSSKQSVAEITTILSNGRVTTVNVLIPPGQRLDQIVKILETEGYKKTDIENALIAVRDHPLLVGVPKNAKLEGYLFPETYSIEPSTSAEQLIRTMLDTFQKRISSSIREGIASQGLSMQQAVILASIIQKEVPEPDVQRTVAQVFISRLKQGIVLGSDVTYMYAAVLSNEPATPALNSPYNTRRVQGLPPTAISNFNLSALQAVASPTKTDYLYFVAGDDGVTHFSRTLAEHEALVEKYCTKLCN